jgi:hypothetical protein
VSLFDYDNSEHVRKIAEHLAKHKSFNKVPDAPKHLGEMLSTGNYRLMEDPRTQQAMRKAGHTGYHTMEKTGKTRNAIPPYIAHKAIGGSMDEPAHSPSLAQMRLQINQHANPALMDSIGVNEALDMDPKIYMNPDPQKTGMSSVGGVADSNGLPVGGIDQNPMQAGSQLLPNALVQQQQQDQQQQGQIGAGAPQQGGTPPNAPQGQTPPMGNMLSMTPQGQALGAMKPPAQPQGLAGGGQPKEQPIKIMKKEDWQYDDSHPSTANLSRAFREAIDHHLSLSPEDRMTNTHLAEEGVAEHIGRAKTGKMKGRSRDLLGKNAKLLKSEKGKAGYEPVTLPDGRGIETTGLALAPAYEEGKFNTCPNHASCKEECLGKTSGNYFKLGGGPDLDAFKGPRLNSLLKTQAFLRDPHSFAVKLHDEIEAAKGLAAKNGNHLGMRLNVLSDINPEVYRPIIEAHPDVTFYDYTKMKYKPIAKNHHYTYSSTGLSDDEVTNPHTNWHQMRDRLESGDNVAMAFTHKRHLPKSVFDEESGKHYDVIDGDSHDFRPLDKVASGEKGVIVGLKNKKATGKMDEAHIDSNGFFAKYDPKEQKTLNAKGKPIFAKDKSGLTIPTNEVVHIKPQKKVKQGEE